jgi:hypothetical protein
VAGAQIDDGWQEQILAAWDEYADTELGPEIRDDAKRFCPVDTGDLRKSIEHVVATDHALLVSAYGSDERWYAVYVERGHLVYHPSTKTKGPEFVPAQPFLMPALTKHISG